MNIQQLTQEVKELKEKYDYFLNQSKVGLLHKDFIADNLLGIKQSAQKLLTLINEGKIEIGCRKLIFGKSKLLNESFECNCGDIIKGIKIICPSCQSELDKNKQILLEMLK